MFFIKKYEITYMACIIFPLDSAALINRIWERDYLPNIRYDLVWIPIQASYKKKYYWIIQAGVFERGVFDDLKELLFLQVW